MINEIIVILTILSGGSLALRALGLNGWPLVPLGLISGVTIYTSLLYLQMLSMHLRPAIPLALTLILPASFWYYRKYSGYTVKFTALPSVLTLTAVALLIVAFSQANMARFHSDSLNFLMVGRAIAIGDSTAINPYNIENRLSTVPAVHALGYYSNNYYLASITPLISLSILGILCWIIYAALKNKVNHRKIIIFSILGILLLVSSHAYLFHSFYLNGHLMMAAYVLILAGCGWLLVRGTSQVPTRVLVGLQAVGIAGLVFTRVEGLFFAAVAILPTLLAPQLSYRHKRFLLLVFGVAILLQNVVKAILLNAKGILLEGASGEIPPTVYVPVIVGLVLICSTRIFEWKLLYKVPKKLLWLSEVGLWAVLLLFFIKTPGILIDSLGAAADHIVFDLDPWGAYLVMLGLLMAVLLILKRYQDQIFLRLPITTFLPIAFILAYLRGVAYRGAKADSLNRMLIQIVPLMVLFIIISIATGENRFQKKLARSKKKART